MDSAKIYWKSDPQWKTLTDDVGYPRPQGNIPMFGALVPQAQNNLMQRYMGVMNENNK